MGFQLLAQRLVECCLYIVKSGISDANAWKYCYVYDPFLRRFPEAVERAKDVTAKRARLILTDRNLRTIVFAQVASLARLFELGPTVLERMIAQLLEEKLAVAISRDGKPWLQTVLSRE